MQSMKVLAVIPARYASTRFPGKPLAMLGGRSIIERVWQRVNRADGIDAVVVATDDERICDHMEQTAGEGSVMMTSDNVTEYDDEKKELMARSLELFRSASVTGYSRRDKIITVDYEHAGEAKQLRYDTERGALI